MAHLLIIGGSDAGISAALRARELAPALEITIVLSDSFPNFSICGLPFFLSGEVADWRSLAHRTAEEIIAQGIHLLMNHTAQAIDPVQKIVTVIDPVGQLQQVTYDQLIIATGATSIRPNVEGLDLPGVYLLRWMSNSFAVQKYLTEQAPKHALIIGGGYIGLEMADALILRGMSVTLVERSATVLKTVEPNLSQLVTAELQRHSVEVINGVNIAKIEQKGSQLLVSGSEGFHRTTDLVIVAVGVNPSTQLAQTAGVRLGVCEEPFKWTARCKQTSPIFMRRVIVQKPGTELSTRTPIYL